MVGREIVVCRKIKENEGEKEISEGCKSVATQTNLNEVNGLLHWNGCHKDEEEKEKKQKNILQFEIYMKCGLNAKRLMLVANMKEKVWLINEKKHTSFYC